MEIPPPSSLDRCRAELEAQGLLQSDRDAIRYAMFPAQALPFFKWRAGQGPSPREKSDPSLGEADLLRRDAARVQESRRMLFGGRGAGSAYME
jgi:pyruvate/oxaloacetate carboxyltransferase